MANLFEDVEDPFADDFNDALNSPPLNKNPSKSGLRGAAAAKKFAASRLGDEYFIDDGSQHTTPHN